MIPTESENPNGLHRRYIVSKESGEPVDPRAVYFVLRLDEFGDDAKHIFACRHAARAYGIAAMASGDEHLAAVGRELLVLIDDLTHGPKDENDGR